MKNGVLQRSHVIGNAFNKNDSGMIRKPGRPPTARCALSILVGIFDESSTTCTLISEVMNISHDSVNRFLLRESYEPKDLFNKAKPLLNLVGGTLNLDDSTLGPVQK